MSFYTSLPSLIVIGDLFFAIRILKVNGVVSPHLKTSDTEKEK